MDPDPAQPIPPPEAVEPTPTVPDPVPTEPVVPTESSEPALAPDPIVAPSPIAVPTPEPETPVILTEDAPISEGDTMPSGEATIPSGNDSQPTEDVSPPEASAPSVPTPASPTPTASPEPTPQPQQSTPQPQPISQSSTAPVTQSPIIPVQVTPEIASLFQSWLTAYQRSFRALGTLGLERKRQRHLDRVVELAGTHGSITRQELRLIMRMSAAQIDKYTHELVANGRLRRIGDHSEGRYGKA